MCLFFVFFFFFQAEDGIRDFCLSRGLGDVYKRQVLMVFAAGLLADAVENMQQLHWLDFGRHVLWNTSGTISEGSSFGDVLHSLLGYADRPTELQAFVWFIY